MKRRDFFRLCKIGGIVLSVMGGLGLIWRYFVEPIGVQTTAITFVAVATFTAIVAYVALREGFEDDGPVDLGSFEVRFAESRDFEQIDNLVVQQLGERALIPKQTTDAWDDFAYPSMRVIVRKKGWRSEALGYYWCLPITEDAYNRLESAAITEFHLKTDDFVDPRVQEPTHLFLMDVIVNLQSHHKDIARHCLVKDLALYLHHLLSKYQTIRKIGVITGTKTGHNYAKKYKFTQVKNYKRKDFPDWRFYFATRELYEEAKRRTDAGLGYIWNTAGEFQDVHPC